MSAVSGAALQLVQDDEADHLLASLERLSGREPEFVEQFYALFFERHPEVTKLFGEHSLSEQEEMVQETFVSLVAVVENEPWLQTNLEAMGKSHAEYGVEDRMYDWLLECMLDALEMTLGADYLDEYGPAWRSALGHLTDVMRAAGARASEPADGPDLK